MFSIIIPTYNEGNNIGELIKYLKEHSDSDETEIIIVDGGSSDSTIQLAKKHGAVILNSPQKGRAAQMNFGAQKAKGEWLYFLHADTLPPQTFTADIEQKFKEGYECGCFRLSFDYSHPVLRFYSWFTRFDVNIFRFGDQSLFAKKALFCKINGFNEKLLVLEDQDIVRRLKTRAQFGIINKPVITSARKYQRFGVFRLQFIFAIIIVLYYLRVRQKTLAHFYRTFMSGAPY